MVKNEALGSKVTSATRLIISYLVTRVTNYKMLRHNFKKSIPTVLIPSMILIVILPQHELILVAKADQKGADPFCLRTDPDTDFRTPYDRETPAFARIRRKKTKRISPYLDTWLLHRDELAIIISYESFKRNKAALALMWDLDARNHEITLLKIKHIRLKEKYGEGEIPHQAKTGSGHILLTFSFPYVRDWLNEHPFRNEPEARLICNLRNGSPIRSEALWTMMKQLRSRIERLLKSASVPSEEKDKLQYLLKAKRFNPYCLRHSTITYDSDYLPEYALKKKCR